MSPILKTSRTLVRARVAVALLFLVNGTGFATWIPHIPFTQRKFGLDEATLGLTLLAIAAGAIVTMPLAGGLIARWGSRRLCILSGIAFCLVIPPLMLISWYPLFVFNLFLLGAFGGALDVAMNAHGVYVEDQYQRAIMSSFHGMFSVGGLVGAGVAGGLLALGWTPAQHTALMAVVLLGLTIFALRNLLPPEPQVADDDATAAPLFALPRERTMVLLAALACFVFMTEGAMADWATVYLEAMPNTSASLAAFGFAAFSLTMAVGRLTGDAVIRALGRVAVVRWGSALGLSGVLVASLSTGPFLAIVGFALVGLGLANVVPILFSAAGYLSPRAPAQGIAAVTTAGYFGFLVGPPVIGLLAKMITLSGAFQLLAASLLLVVFSAQLVRKK